MNNFQKLCICILYIINYTCRVSLSLTCACIRQWSPIIPTQTGVPDVRVPFIIICLTSIIRYY